MRWWGIGWLVRAAPQLIIGGLFFGPAVRMFAARRWRLPVDIVAAALLITIALYVYRPLTRVDLVSFTHVGRGGRATYVSTGLLPLRVSAVGGSQAGLHAGGQVASVMTHKLTGGDWFVVHVRPDIGLWWWAALVAICFVPALWTLAVGTRPEQPPSHAAEN